MRASLTGLLWRAALAATLGLAVADCAEPLPGTADTGPVGTDDGWRTLPDGRVVGPGEDPDDAGKVNPDAAPNLDTGADMDGGTDMDGGGDAGPSDGRDSRRLPDGRLLEPWEVDEDGGLGPPDAPSPMGAEVCGNGFDDDRDGLVDEMCTCLPGTRQHCYPGADTRAAGIATCAWGMQTCTGGQEIGTWGPCTGFGAPTMEVCDGRDNDCDREVDEGCTCTPGASRACYAGPMGTMGVGACRAGTQTCTAGGAWGNCMGQYLPVIETCDEGRDNDCDGMVDEGCRCRIGERRDCYTGPMGTRAVGVCRGGSQLCVEMPDGTTDWSRCIGQVIPAATDECNGNDDDCDNQTDETCPCRPGETRPCYGGPDGTAGRGPCRAGTMTCTSAGAWTNCMGAVLPTPERCDRVDNDCNGDVDEVCRCPPGETMTYSRRDLASMGTRSELRPADGMPIMPSACGPGRCPEHQVAVEVSRGVFRCVDPPPPCPGDRYPTWTRAGVWRCDRACEIVIQYGHLYDFIVVCAPRPDVTCGPGQTPHYIYETERWACRTTCDNGQYDIFPYAGYAVCVPC